MSPTTVQMQKLGKEMSDLKRGLAEIKRLILAMDRDEEGEYRSEFVEKILKLSRQKGERVYAKGDFLKG